jgi:hypothetical protein
MKYLYLLLLLPMLLLASACKKDNPVVSPPKAAAVKPRANDSISFVIDGKWYNPSSDTTYFGPLYGNKGTNLRLSDKPGDWFLRSWQANKYWAGAADSVQYFTGCDFRTSRFGATFCFIKNYNIAETIKSGGMQVPKTTENYYAIKDYTYAADFGREAKDEGVAITIGNYNKGGSSFSPLQINKKSKLTTDSQKGSSFKIIKIEEVKGTDYIILEATFEANLYNEEEESIKVTNGFLRLRTLKYGFRYQ